ncbi:hypothetical protein GCM10023169_08130 [Georgenia halophila]|uniref:Rv2175c C-terminal domain-containing protein n=1 Tax=Georgenia halophila TaxID=620889 RepID=A0ABP8KXU8_9MICO
MQAEHNLYTRIDAEFGLLSAAEASRRLGRSQVCPATSPPRSTGPIIKKHRADHLVAVRRGHETLYPRFQFTNDRQALPVIAELSVLAAERGCSETGVVQWMCGPTTYLGRKRPVDLLATHPGRVVHGRGGASIGGPGAAVTTGSRGIGARTCSPWTSSSLGSSPRART